MSIKTKHSKNYLITAATFEEIQLLFQYLKKNYNFKKINTQHFVFDVHNHHWHLVITGVGMVSTSYHLGKLSANKYDWAVNVGIAGAFDKALKIGEIVIIQEDIFSEMGAEDGSHFIPLSQLHLGNEKIIPKKLFVPKFFSYIKTVKAITVNTVHGKLSSIKEVTKLYQPQVETMESAAFYFACEQNKWKNCVIRSISNYVEKRNKDKWNIPLAIKNLNDLMIRFIEQS